MKLENLRLHKEGKPKYSGNRRSYRARNMDSQGAGHISDGLDSPGKTSGYWCDICKLSCEDDEIAIRQHKVDVKHVKKAAAEQMLLKINQEYSCFEQDPESGMLCCLICNITANSPLSLVSHFNGSNHKKKMKGVAANDNNRAGTEVINSDNWCEICKCSASGSQATHISGSKHKKKLISYKKNESNGQDTAAPSEKESEFVIKQKTTYEKRCPEFEHQQVIGSYSVDTERKIRFDKSQLKFIDRRFLPEYEEMKVEMDVKQGPDKFRSYIGSQNTNFEMLLQWLLSNASDLVSEDKSRLSVDFICAKGCLTMIMKSLYFQEYFWKMHVFMYNGSIYMKSWGNEIFSYDAVDSLVAQSGHNFERLVVGGDSTEGTDCNSEFRYVLCSNLDDMKLLYNAKLDCVDPEKYEGDLCDKGSFMEVNCCLEPTGSQMKKKFLRNKTGQAWIANHLGGVPRVVFGFRTYDFIVNTLKLFNTEDLPEMGKDYWTPNGCMNFLNTFLKYVKTIAHKHPGKVIEFEKEKHVGRIRWKVLDVQNMLPTWYTDNLFGEQQQT